MTMTADNIPMTGDEGYRVDEETGDILYDMSDEDSHLAATADGELQLDHGWRVRVEREFTREIRREAGAPAQAFRGTLVYDVELRELLELADREMYVRVMNHVRPRLSMKEPSPRTGAGGWKATPLADFQNKEWKVSDFLPKQRAKKLNTAAEAASKLSNAEKQALLVLLQKDLAG